MTLPEKRTPDKAANNIKLPAKFETYAPLMKKRVLWLLKAFPNPQDFIREYAPANLRSKCRKFTSVKDLFSELAQKSPKLSEINDTYGIVSFNVTDERGVKSKKIQPLVETWLTTQMQSLNNALNIKNILTIGQMDEIAEFIYDDFFSMNIAEVDFVFTRMKKGYHGKIIVIDSSFVLSCFRDYVNEKVSVQNSIERARKEDNIPTDKRAEFVLTNLAKRLSGAEKKDKEV